MTWLRAALGGLTTRGRAFLAAGVAATASAFILGQRDLLRIGVLLIVLPAACALVIGRAQLRLALTRTISPARVVSGDTARVRLELENLTRLVTRVLLAEDTIPYSLGPSPRFVMARLPGGRRAAVTYSVPTQTRGRYEIGPLRLQMSAPFGLCEVTRAFTATDPLIVVPRTWPLSGAPTGGHWGGSGEAMHGTAAASGVHDIAIREYRYGDDLRRVHWRSTARRGELMVRREEQPRQMRATVLLDSRADSHRGDGPASSFEWAVSATASVAVHLSGLRYGVRLLTDDPTATWSSASWTGLIRIRKTSPWLTAFMAMAKSGCAVERIRTGAVSEEELRVSKSSFIDTFPRTFESPAATARTFANDEVIGRPHSYWTDYRRRIEAVTAENVRAAAAKYLDSGKLTMLVVGKWSEIEPGDAGGLSLIHI